MWNKWGWDKKLLSIQVSPKSLGQQGAFLYQITTTPLNMQERREEKQSSNAAKNEERKVGQPLKQYTSNQRCCQNGNFLIWHSQFCDDIANANMNRFFSRWPYLLSSCLHDFCILSKISSKWSSLRLLPSTWGILFLATMTKVASLLQGAIHCAHPSSLQLMEKLVLYSLTRIIESQQSWWHRNHLQQILLPRLAIVVLVHL